MIELMVAVSIFAVVALVATATLIAVSNSYHRSQNVKLLIDNLSFALDSISLKIREGRIYCIDSTNGRLGLYFNDSPIKYEFDTTTNPPNQTINKCAGTAPCIPITSGEIIVDKFTIGYTTDEPKAAVTMVINAHAGHGLSGFSTVMQTTAAERAKRDASQPVLSTCSL